MTTAQHEVRSHLPYDRLTADALRGLLDTNGYAYVNGIPEGFDHAGFLQQIGPLMPQYDGELIWSIEAKDRYANVYHSLNTNPLFPHTECYEYPGRPPKYLALWCLVPNEDEGGHTTLADMYAFVETLTDEEREVLTSRRHTYFSSDGVKDMQLGRTGEHPFMELRPGRPPIVRFSINNVRLDDDTLLKSVHQRGVEFFDEHHVAVRYEPQSLLIWDNHRMTHSRTGYTDRRRLLRRVWLDEN